MNYMEIITEIAYEHYINMNDALDDLRINLKWINYYLNK